MMTGVGVILGTAAYMAPEQAKGREADKRSDIWAFGCVLYEMLAGRRAFEGEDVADTLAQCAQGQPDWIGLPFRRVRCRSGHCCDAVSKRIAGSASPTSLLHSFVHRDTSSRHSRLMRGRLQTGARGPGTDRAAGRTRVAATSARWRAAVVWCRACWLDGGRHAGS